MLNRQFISGRFTAFTDVKRILPGETLVVKKGKIIDRLYLPALPDHGPRGEDVLGLESRLDDALADSVNLHQRSDVPYGMFLSGGVDAETNSTETVQYATKSADTVDSAFQELMNA